MYSVRADEEMLVCAFKSNGNISKDMRSYIVTIWHQLCHKNAVASVLSLRQPCNVLIADNSNINLSKCVMYIDFCIC